jgi:hypothetical protein
MPQASDLAPMQRHRDYSQEKEHLGFHLWVVGATNHQVAVNLAHTSKSRANQILREQSLSPMLRQLSWTNRSPEALCACYDNDQAQLPLLALLVLSHCSNSIDRQHPQRRNTRTLGR